MPLPLESVPNVSEGRDAAVIAAIGDAVAAHASLLDVHTDVDHNRSVYTLVGDEKQLVDALLAGISRARERIVPAHLAAPEQQRPDAIGDRPEEEREPGRDDEGCEKGSHRRRSISASHRAGYGLAGERRAGLTTRPTTSAL